MPNNDKSPEVMKNDLETQFDQTNRFNEKANSDQYLMKSKVRQFKMDTMKKIFKMIKDLGYDPSDLDDMNKFVERLGMINPDLIPLFEIIMSAAEPGDTNPAKEQQEPMLMNPDSGPRPDTMPLPEGGGMPPMGGEMPPQGGGMPPMGGGMPPQGGGMPPMGGGASPLPEEPQAMPQI